MDPWAVSLLVLTGPLRWPGRCVRAPSTRGIPRAGKGAVVLVDEVIERVHPRRRASDLADERANKAAKYGDLVALWVASGQAEAARRRREEWLERQRGTDASNPDPIGEPEPA